MQENEITFHELKRDVGLLLDSFIRTNEMLAALIDLNGDLFNGMRALEEAKTLNRIIGRLSPTEETCDLMKATLKLVAKDCKSDGAPVMAYETDALLERVSHFQVTVSASA
jgi:hypothetical protein